MHPINEVLDRGMEKKPCDSGCPYYKFDHLDAPCVLSDVYSVKKDQPCAIYVEKLEEGK